jgi:hypothetical protein
MKFRSAWLCSKKDMIIREVTTNLALLEKEGCIGCGKKVVTFDILEILHHKLYNLHSLLKRCVVKNSIETIRIDPYWLVLIISLIPKMSRSMTVLYTTAFNIIKILGRLFLFFNINLFKQLL